MFDYTLGGLLGLVYLELQESKPEGCGAQMLVPRNPEGGPTCFIFLFEPPDNPTFAETHLLQHCGVDSVHKRVFVQQCSDQFPGFLFEAW